MFHNYCQVFIRWIAWGKRLFLCLAFLVLRALKRDQTATFKEGVCSFSFTKRKHGPSNKIWALHHMARATAVTKKVDAVALKVQKTVLSTSVKTLKQRTFSAREKWILHNRKLLQELDDDLKWFWAKTLIITYIFNVAWCEFLMFSNAFL